MAKRDEVALVYILVHEVCHAVSTLKHGHAWLQRMEAARSRAAQLGQAVLADFLQKDIDKYEYNVTNRMADPVYGSITDILTDIPDATYDTVLLCLSDRFSKSPTELEQQYPYLRKDYDRARSELDEF